MVPNPFRLLSRLIAGDGSEPGSREESREDALDPGGYDERVSETDEDRYEEGEPIAAEDENYGPREDDDPALNEDQDDGAPVAEQDERSDAEDSRSTGGGHGEEIDASGIPAPSIGPNTKITTESPEDRLARHEQSDVDAMGLDKRREVVGGSYSPSFARQATMYGVFLAVVIGIAIGFKLLADELDQPPKNNPAVAPWKDSNDPAAPSEIDFPPDNAPEQVPTGPDPTSGGGADNA